MAVDNKLPLRERNKLRTRSEIRAAALEVLQREGFSDSSIEKIAKAAGTSKGTVYVYFPDGLNDIYREIYIDLSRSLLDAGCEAREAAAHPVQRIVALAQALLDMCVHQKTGAFYMMLSPSLLPVLKPVLGQASRRYVTMVAEDLQDLCEKMDTSKCKVLAELLVGAMREAATIVSEAPGKKRQLLAGLEELISGLAHISHPQFSSAGDDDLRPPASTDSFRGSK